MNRNACDLCGKDTSVSPWVIMNRVVLGTGRCRSSIEFLNDDDCIWEVGNAIPSDEEAVSGKLLCFPACLQLFLEGRMIEADIAMGHTK